MMKKMVHTLLFLSIILMFASCEHKKLWWDYDGTLNVTVTFDWSYAPEAAPASMNLFLFPKEDDESLQYEMAGCKGGVIRVYWGVYDALCLNSDTKIIIYKNTGSRETFEVTTRETSLFSTLFGIRSSTAPRAPGAEDEKVAFSPDSLWSGTVDDVPLGVTDLDTTITLYPKDALSHYSVEIRNATNLKYVEGMSASLSGLAGGLFLSSGETTDESVTVPFEVSMGNNKTAVAEDVTGTITGDFLTFGYNRNPEIKQYLTVYAILLDDSKLYYTYDVTDQVHSAPDPYHVHIIVDGLPLPQPIVNGGGFQPTVEEWKSVNIYLPM